MSLHNTEAYSHQYQERDPFLLSQYAVETRGNIYKVLHLVKDEDEKKKPPSYFISEEEQSKIDILKSMNWEERKEYFFQNVEYTRSNISDHIILYTFILDGVNVSEMQIFVSEEERAGGSLVDQKIKVARMKFVNTKHGYKRMGINVFSSFLLNSLLQNTENAVLGSDQRTMTAYLLEQYQKLLEEGYVVLQKVRQKYNVDFPVYRYKTIEEYKEDKKNYNNHNI